jgi:hypothetical protein
MVAKTLHVFPSNGSWLVKREGKAGKVFLTKREAVNAARMTIKKETAGQFVVHGKDGEIKEYGVFGMTPVQDPPEKSARAREIARVVGKLALSRVQANPPGERAS